MRVFKLFIAALVVGLGLVALIFILPARPVPKSAKEAVAQVLLKEIFHAQKLYYQEWGCYTSIENLPDNKLGNPEKIKRIVQNEPVIGYFYKSSFEAKSWWVAAWPDISSPTKGKRSFYLDQTGSLRRTCYVKEDDTRANASSPVWYTID